MECLARMAAEILFEAVLAKKDCSVQPEKAPDQFK